MSVLTIRNCKRYATRQQVLLRRAGRKSVAGLLIELSQQGMRISNLGPSKFEVGDSIVVAMLDGVQLKGAIRWAHDGIAGVTLDQALHLNEVRDMLDFCRRRQEAYVPSQPEAMAATA